MNSVSMSPRRAILASRIYAPEAGAAAYRLAALVAALDNAGYRTKVLTTRPPEPVAAGRGVRRWPVLRDRSGAVRGYLQYASFDIPLFFRLLLSRRPDVVIVEPPPTTGVVCRIVCQLRRIPYVYFAADVVSTAAAGIGVNRFIVSALRRVESWVLRGASAVLAVTPGVQDEVVSLGAKADRVTMVGTGIDTDLFSLTAAAQAQPHPYLVYAGTMSEVHGAGIFVEAFARVASKHPTARLKMFGHGVEVDAIQEKAERLAPGRVDFSAPVSGASIAGWFRGANAGLASVMPGSGYGFAFATKALAAISCGTPVVYAGVGPLRELISDNALGWSVDWDVDKVAAAMDAAFAAEPDEAEKRRLSEWVLHTHSLRTVAQRAVTAINRVAKHHVGEVTRG